MYSGCDVYLRVMCTLHCTLVYVCAVCIVIVMCTAYSDCVPVCVCAAYSAASPVVGGRRSAPLAVSTLAMRRPMSVSVATDVRRGGAVRSRRVPTGRPESGQR